MLVLIVFGTVLSCAIGLAVKIYADRNAARGEQLTWSEFALGTVIMLLVVTPLVSWLGIKLAVHSQVTYHENWGGYEVQAEWVRSPTHRDGNMRWSYQGDPYQVWVDTSYTDSKGKYHKDGHWETRYHSIPYCSEEWSFYVHTTLGTFTIADRNLPTDPNQYRYRSYVSVPDYVAADARGVPPFWLQAQQRIGKGDPGPVTVRRDYVNYILASHDSILRKHHAAIARYQKEGVLPAINSSIHDFYSEDRVYFVGTRPPGDWQQSINRFNAALGSQLQGDLHLVLVDANSVKSPDEYTQALTAYWLADQFGKDAFAKNGILLVVGTSDGKTVAWSRASTGMPIGNEMMVLQLRDGLAGKPLTPADLLGTPRARLAGSVEHPAVTVVHTRGAIEQIVFGDNHFQRVHMIHDGGYAYLLREVRPTGWQCFGIMFFCALLATFMWIAFVQLDVPFRIQQKVTSAVSGELDISYRQAAWAGAVVVLIFFSFWAGGKGRTLYNIGVSYETALDQQYLINQNELSAYVTGFYEQLNLARAKSDAMNGILVDAVKGRYDEKEGGKLDRSKAIAAIEEAYPELKGLNIYDRLIDYVQASRQHYKEQQNKLLDELRAYDKWRAEGLLQQFVVAWMFPSGKLEARVGDEVIHGADAREQMYLIVVASQATRAYKTGEQTPLPGPTGK